MTPGPPAGPHARPALGAHRSVRGAPRPLRPGRARKLLWCNGPRGRYAATLPLARAAVNMTRARGEHAD